MSAVLQHAAPHWREPHDRQRWPLAAGAALLLEAAIIGALLWLADHDSAPPPPAPMQIVLATPKPAPQAVAPRTPKPPEPKPLPKPIPKPDVKPPPRPLLHKIAPKPVQPAPPLPTAESPPSPVPDTRPAMPVIAPRAQAKPLPPAVEAPDVASIKAHFEAELRSAIQAAVHYPQAARLMRLSGKTLISFTFTHGRATAISIARSSGNDSLDQAAMIAVRNAKYPPTPTVLGNTAMRFTLWVMFNISN